MHADKIVGALNAAEWPHCQLSNAEKIRTSPSMIRIMRTALPRASTMMSQREAADPRRPHWHIGLVGVLPELQGRGIGKILSESFLAEVEGDEAAAFLESDVDRNVVTKSWDSPSRVGKRSSGSTPASCGETPHVATMTRSSLSILIPVVREKARSRGSDDRGSRRSREISA